MSIVAMFGFSLPPPPRYAPGPFMPGSATDSDFGPELDYDDALEAQLLLLEQNGGVGDRGGRERQTPLRRVEVEVEDGDRGGNRRQRDSSATAVDLARTLADADDVVMQDSPRNLWCVRRVKGAFLEPRLTPSLYCRDQFRRHRNWGALSVSDLSGPSWCEVGSVQPERCFAGSHARTQVQHSYRLASKPYLPPSERPATITTASGAEIAVDQVRTVKRENTLIKGRAVHKEIEKEVMGDVQEVQVDVTGKEEWWALRVLNTVVGLEALLTTGRVVRRRLLSLFRPTLTVPPQRELPVVGWVNDFLVFGVIDDVERRELPPPPSTQPQDAPELLAKRKTKGKKTKAAPTSPAKKEQQQTLTQFFSPSSSPAKDGGVLDLTEDSPVEGAKDAKTVEAHPRWGFILSDTKTRCISRFETLARSY